MLKRVRPSEWNGKDFIRYITMKLDERGITYTPKSYKMDIMVMYRVLKWARERMLTHEYLIKEIDEIMATIISKHVTSLNFLPRCFKKIKPPQGRDIETLTPDVDFKYTAKTQRVLKLLKESK